MEIPLNNCPSGDLHVLLSWELSSPNIGPGNKEMAFLDATIYFTVTSSLEVSDEWGERIISECFRPNISLQSIKHANEQGKTHFLVEREIWKPVPEIH